MPTISIDTFFACSLMVSVVILSTASLAGLMQVRIDSLRDLNEAQYLRAISDHIVSGFGDPRDWGSNSSTFPESLGLAENGSLHPSELDIDKICRLNPENAFALSYLDILSAVKLDSVALGVSVSQLLDVSIELWSNTTLESSTAYSFRVSVNQDGTPITASLHGYMVANEFYTDVQNDTSIRGIGYLDIDVPNTSNGTASVTVFARTSVNTRITAYAVYRFGHLSTDPPPNNTFLGLSPLDYTLYLNQNFAEIDLEECYAFSYEYRTNLTFITNTTYAIPSNLDRSPMVLVICGLNASTFFIEWTTYPQVPLVVGSDFADSECHAFSYIVTIKETLYELTLRFGDMN